MDLEQKIDLLLSRGITRTRFESMNLNAGMLGGLPIGDSECKAVILSVNQYQLYGTDTQTGLAAGKFYYGDSQQQSKEMIILHNNRDTGRVPSSDIIFCTNLNQVWVRYTGDDPDQLQIEIQIYY